jgi:hypothetical protein
LDGLLPSGTYSVETRRDRSSLLALFASNRTSTWMRICRNPGVFGSIEHIQIDPRDLDAALAQDASFESRSERTPVTIERRALAADQTAAKARTVSHGETQAYAERTDRP